MTTLSKGYYQCKKCNTIMIPYLTESGPHTKLTCSNCSTYIKFATKEEVDHVMQALTGEV